MGLLVRGGTLIDGNGGSPTSDSVVAIDGKTFTHVGDGAGLEGVDDFGVIDASGLTIVPGLIDAHAHQTYYRTHGPLAEQWAKGPMYLLARSVGAALQQLKEGCTTIAELGAVGASNLVMREATAAGLLVGPRILTCGQPLTRTGGHAYEICVEADGADGMRRAARQLLKNGVDFIKIMMSDEGPSDAISARERRGQTLTVPQLTLAEVSAAVEEAHWAGKVAMAHANSADSIRPAIEAGVDCIHHGLYIDRPLAEEMASHDVYLVPTISVYEESMATWERGEIKDRGFVQLAKAHLDSVRNAIEAGVKLAAGTDAIADLPFEMQRMVDLGLSPMEAITAATKTPATLLGIEDEVGTVDVGKSADLVLVRGNPLDNILQLRNVEYVIKQGQVFRPTEMLELPPGRYESAKANSIGYVEYVV